MSTRPLPPHGSYARANGSPRYRKPCKCEPCLITRRRHDKRWKVNRALGRPAMVDAAPARERLIELRKTHTWASLSTATGIAASNLYYISNGTRAEIQRTTLAAILAVRPALKADEHRQIDALGSRRRLQALMSIGHSVRTVARECRMSKDRAHDIALGLQPTVRADVAARIADAYTRLAFRPPGVDKFTSRTRNLAAARKWHGPLAWDDIDDPNAKPDTTRGRQRSGQERKPVDPARVARLTDAGKSAEAIAAELGVHKRTIVRARSAARKAQVAA